VLAAVPLSSAVRLCLTGELFLSFEAAPPTGPEAQPHLSIVPTVRHSLTALGSGTAAGDGFFVSFRGSFYRLS